ncbi:MAG: menaquinone biosynthesis protein [Syntrophomonadaceae bacterium]|jgi:chorismate dehydratase|nr:menaquinone biosynthesis protein [Syntrophomonadaceae bacterium]
MKPRVGHIKFINCYPLFYGLTEKKLLPDIDLIRDYPGALSHMLKNNALDMAWIPSIDYARDYEDYVLLPNISVSSEGEVKSIFLFSKYPAGEMDGKSIAMTNASATAQALLRVLMANYYKCSPRYFASDPNLNAMLEKADAALLIGDDALRAYYKNSARLFIYDLGGIWKEYTGLPMVWAVWAVREEWAEKNLQFLVNIDKVFAEAMRLSLREIDKVAAKAAQKEEFGIEYLLEYYRCLKYDFDGRKQKGLLEYYRQAHGLGLIDQTPPLKFWDLSLT